jgi:hypothetical protein
VVMSVHLPVERLMGAAVFGFADLLAGKARATSAVPALRVFGNTVSKITLRPGASQ